MARPRQDGKIMLRWAVTTPLAWRKLNEHGYELKRYTITRNNTTLAQPVEKSIGVFRPRPLEEWMPFVEQNDNAAVMAQSLYGESFDVEGMDQLSTFVNLAEEQEQRFTWGLYAADQNYEVAQMAGLAYVDMEVYPNEKYLYKITSMVPEDVLEIQEGGVFTGLQDYEDLPKPLDLAVVFFDGKSMLSWNYAIHNQVYNSYFVERSENGIDFQRLNDLPLTTLNNSEKTDPLRMFYTDSITNGKTYHYRIRGKTPFGEVSPVSEVVSGSGEKQLAYVPHITSKYYEDDKTVLLEWEFLEEGNDLITGFELNRGDNVDGPYKVVVKNIPPEARKVRYDSLMPTNYMTISALGKNGGSRTSFPALVQPVDSVPPHKPKGFHGLVDSLGVVTLSWEANTDEDILGYRIFKGHNRNEEYSQITVSPHQASIYYDSVSVKNLNSKVYYQLIAVDQRFNMSEPSDVLEIKKPDFIKPTQPVFKSYEIKEGKVHLTWANSSSDDVVKYQIYRREKDSEGWMLIYEIDNRQSTVDSTQNVDSLSTAQLPTEKLPTAYWIDEDVKEGQQYSYTIIAIDDSTLESDPAPPLTVIVPKTTLYPPLEGLYGEADREKGSITIRWKAYNETNATKIAIYKGTEGKPKNLLKEIPVDTKGIVDSKLKPNNTYEYLFQVVFTDGGVSGVAELNVKY
ncbi:fibronectin type III domain-containing protein [Flagellimonas hadalis]|uniref:Fibronectin type III domain-containing protein n=1 Tax=Flagellimonas hadalis TaxID=2597517 RepID=A0A5N5IVZ5_9FLAO|nr:fibronectin type III domain-containing protein [Allomuricauda hadalis]KAB5491579.1 fibronectin type III domain-containing protein [Allomuricauda hadalis]